MERSRRVLAIASAGGHWVQLRRMRPAWEGCAVVYASTEPGLAAMLAREAAEADRPAPPFHALTDANRWQKLRLLRQMLEVLWLVLRLRPEVVVTTGASIGYFAVRAGRLVGARCIWVDSIANVEELSLSGRKAGPHCTLWLTQWPELADEEAGPRYRGAVL